MVIAYEKKNGFSIHSLFTINIHRQTQGENGTCENMLQMITINPCINFQRHCVILEVTVLVALIIFIAENRINDWSHSSHNKMQWFELKKKNRLQATVLGLIVLVQ